MYIELASQAWGCSPWCSCVLLFNISVSIRFEQDIFWGRTDLMLVGPTAQVNTTPILAPPSSQANRGQRGAQNTRLEFCCEQGVVHWQPLVPSEESLLNYYMHILLLDIYELPVVPHKAVAEVSKIDNYRRGELLWCMDGRANPLMDRKVVGVVVF